MNVYSHGSYTEKDGDGGLADFNRKVSLSMDDYFQFEQKAIEISERAGRKAVFIIIGDHKPSLNKTYFITKTVSPDHFMAAGESLAKNDFRFKDNPTAAGLMEIGRVAFFIRIMGQGDHQESEFIKPLSDKPLFCFPAYLAGEIDLSKSNYFARLKDVCDENAPLALIDPEWQRKTFAPELFAEQLF
ncbi:hypothetical protein D3C87_1543540 [compost metagenome]